jgi:hypothetical protein
MIKQVEKHNKLYPKLRQSNNLMVNSFNSLNMERLWKMLEVKLLSMLYILELRWELFFALTQPHML